jgi:2-desacetyl-2-hydroxyethyl bacteriochlorophyllide A dehydrogenase
MPQRIIFPEKGKVELQQFQLPDVGPGDIQIRTHYSLMSIGTETTILQQKYDPDTHYDRIFSFPQLKTGVQAIGKVERCGDAVDEFKSGDSIYMRMAHGSHQVLPADQCSLVPDDVNQKQACWCGLAKTAFRAAWAAQFESCESVLIVGAGPVGQMAIRWAAAADVAELWVCDLSEFRLSHAQEAGATGILHGDIESSLDTISAMHGGAGPPIVVDSTGNALVFPQALAAAAKFGKIILLGDTGYPGRQCLTSDAMTKGLTIQATHDSHDVDGWTQRRVDARFFELYQSGRFPLDGLITHEFAPSDCEKAYTLAMQQRDATIGILYDWTDTA